MSYNTASAQPEMLYQYSQSAARDDEAVEQLLSTLDSAIDEFLHSCREYPVYVGDIVGDIRSHIRNSEEKTLWVYHVGYLFELADTGMEIWERTPDQVSISYDEMRSVDHWALGLIDMIDNWLDHYEDYLVPIVAGLATRFNPETLRFSIRTSKMLKPLPKPLRKYIRDDITELFNHKPGATSFKRVGLSEGPGPVDIALELFNIVPELYHNWRIYDDTNMMVAASATDITESVLNVAGGMLVGALAIAGVLALIAAAPIAVPAVVVSGAVIVVGVGGGMLGGQLGTWIMENDYDPNLVGQLVLPVVGGTIIGEHLNFSGEDLPTGEQWFTTQFYNTLNWLFPPEQPRENIQDSYPRDDATRFAESLLPVYA